VEHVCPDCDGKKLKKQRLMVTVNGKNIYELGAMNFSEMQDFLKNLPPGTIQGRQQKAGEQVLREVTNRLDLLLGIGLDYLNLNRKSATLSGGESQRIRLSTQISSGLMGMLYVLDEPSIGLHPKDNVKLIETLRRLRDIGNTVIVVEHDMRVAAGSDWVMDIGPGAGDEGGDVVAFGTPAEVAGSSVSRTAPYLSRFRARLAADAPAPKRLAAPQ
jgi:excinuclease ABC subunit A